MDEKLLRLISGTISAIAADSAVDVNIATVSEALVRVDQEIYEVEYDDIDFQDIIPIENLNDTAVQTFRYYYVEKAGKSELGKENGPINYVDAMIKGKDIKIHRGNVGYKYGIHELEQASRMRTPLDPLKAQTAMETTLETAQNVCYHGDANRDISGFYNNDDVAVIAKKVAKTWATMTPIEKLGEVNHLFSSPYKQSRKKQFKRKSKTNRLMLTTEIWADMATTPLSKDNPNYTILDYIVAKSPWITNEDQIVDSIHLEAGVMRAYQYDKKKVSFIWGHKLRWLAPQREDLSIKRVGDYSFGGLVIKQDLAVVEKRGL